MMNMMNEENGKKIDYKAMNDWAKFMRRHSSNVFAAIFQDRETITDITNIIQSISQFFNIPEPKVFGSCQSMAQILTEENDRNSEVHYNMKMLMDNGINNHDAFVLCMVHELTHQYLCKERIGLFVNELWMQELAADMMTGIYSYLHHLATGKYKYTVGTQEASITHPDGHIRQIAVDFGRLYFERTVTHKKITASQVLNLLPLFVYSHYKELRESWGKVFDEIINPTIKESAKPIEIYGLPDTNLIKQALLKMQK